MDVTCNYIYKLETSAPELFFAADDDYSARKYAASLYKQTTASSTCVGPWSVGSSVKNDGDWIGVEYDDHG